MPIIVFGLNHRTAGIDLRGRASILENVLDRALKQLVSSAPFIDGAIILSTCNRTELHTSVSNVGKREAVDHLTNWFANFRNLTLADLEGSIYFRWKRKAVKHIMSVAAGLDSQVLGEPQIFGQFKSAFDKAVEADTVNSELEHVVRSTIETGKRIRTNTELGRNSISVAQAAVTMAKRIYSDLKSTNSLLIGAGDTICLVSKHLHSAGVKQVSVANRTLKNAQSVAEQINGNALPLAKIGQYLHDYDIVISSTSSATPVLSRDLVAAACSKRRYRPMFIVDLAVPRDIDPAVSALENVYVYTIDDLTSVIESNLQSRKEAAKDAKKIINDAYEVYETENRIREASSIIADFRSQVDETRTELTNRALSRVRSGEDPEEVINRLAHDLSNKLANQPTSTLRKAIADQDPKLVETVRKLYALDK